jgi:hypothetical protein
MTTRDIAVLNKMRYTPLATDALCPMPYALCPMPARAPHVTEKGYSFEEFIAQYGDNTRYELIDEELRDRSPTGPHEAVAGSIAGRIYVEIFRTNFNWLVPKNCLIKPGVGELRYDEAQRRSPTTKMIFLILSRNRNISKS